MKKEQAKPAPSSSLRTLILFCVVVAVILIASLCYRVFILVKNSKFDGENGFVVAMEQRDGKKATIYGFDPLRGTVATLRVTASHPVTNLQQELSVPFDAVLSRRTISDRVDFPFEFASTALYNPKARTDISLLDAVRLWWLFRTTPERDRTQRTLSLPQDPEALDAALGTLFLDSKLENEKQTIAIVNGTVVSGLGGRLEQLLSRIGGSVISITTAHQTIPQSRIIYYGKRTYTVDRISRILSYPTEAREGSNVSDIVVEIGNDEQRTTKF